MARKPNKRCFVTIGATAPFDALIRAVLGHNFLQALKDANYTELRIQYGSVEGKTIYDDRTRQLGEGDPIQITGFGFKPEGLREEMLAIKQNPSLKQAEGVVFSHAGSGSILEALRLGIPLVVVPNTALLHNHQLELAEELAKQEYVIHGRLDNLSASIADTERLRQKLHQWPPVTSGDEKDQRGLNAVMDQEMGWLD